MSPMSMFERTAPPASLPTPDEPSGPKRRRWRRRVFPAAVATVAVAGALAVVGASPASAAPTTVTNATFRWGVNVEVQSAAFFGGCNYLSAGASDGTEAQYEATDGNVAIVKDGATPTYADKCTLTSGLVNQEVVWSGGTGTVDPETGEATLTFDGQLSLNFYGGMVPFTIEDPVVTVDASGDGTIVATVFGYGSSMEDPNVKVPLDPVPGVVVGDLSGVDAGASGFTATPDYAGVEYTAPEGATPQNRTVTGWGSWPTSWVDFQQATGLSSYWYSSGSGLDSRKPPTAITVTYGTGGGDPTDPTDPTDPAPGEDEQSISVVVPDGDGDPTDPGDPGELVWTIDGTDRTVSLGEASDAGTYLHATGEIKPVRVTDTRTGGPPWSISGQVSDFSGGLSGRYLGWSPKVITAGAGALAGDVTAAGIDGADGLSVPALLAAAAAGHELGTAVVGADLDLRLPAETPAGTYTATLTITALS